MVRSRIQSSVAGLCHPYLHLSSFSLTGGEYDTLARVLFGYRSAYIKAFRSFLCYLGMRPAHRGGSEMLTFEFDAEGWNRQGYRLGKGGVGARGSPGFSSFDTIEMNKIILIIWGPTERRNVRRTNKSL